MYTSLTELGIEPRIFRFVVERLDPGLSRHETPQLVLEASGEENHIHIVSVSFVSTVFDLVYVVRALAMQTTPSIVVDAVYLRARPATHS